MLFRSTCNPAAPDAPQCPGGSVCVDPWGICSNPEVGEICAYRVPGCPAKGGTAGKKGGKKKGGKKGKKGKRK